MTSDTIKQKFLYNVPLLDNDFPMVLTEKLGNDIEDKYEKYYFSEICDLTKEKLVLLIEEIKRKETKIILIENDLINFENPIIKNAIEYHFLAFAYWFKKNDLIIISK